MKKILALDLSSTCGAAFDGIGHRPQFATKQGTMPDDEDFSGLFSNLWQWMSDLVAFQRPDAVAIEAPWVPIETSKRAGTGRPSNPAIVYMLVGMAAVVETYCALHGIDCYKVAVSTVRKNFIGNGRAEKAKQVVLQRCRQLGWTPKNDHEGDAAALWAYTKSILDPAFAYTTTPLFAERHPQAQA